MAVREGIDQPWRPIFYSGKKPEVQAVKALSLGQADETQQKLALDFILKDICKTYEMSYRPDSTHNTSFAEGMRHCGNQLAKFINTPIQTLFPGGSE